ncbi:hypothetical protein [Amycolatopsis sp. NPDC051371]|uniref:hypothetical protein n=1 Tax=Amycolatopsis sp. NPDC051371 TaxID=3155800 RepID=UPI00341A0495
MTQGSGGQSPPSTTETAKDEAREVATTAADRGSEVAQTAAQEVKHVAEHAQREARDLLREGREQLESQARDGQRKAAESLHQLAGQLDRMAEQTDSPGVAGDVARQVSDRTRSVAEWLEHREPGDLLDEVRRFARRRPGAFLVGAAVAGAVVGRLTRGVVAQQQHENSGSSPDGRAAAAVPPQHTGPAGIPAVPPAPGPGGTGYPPPVAPGGYNAPQPGPGGVTPQPAPGGFTAPQPGGPIAPDPLPQPTRYSTPGQVP